MIRRTQDLHIVYIYALRQWAPEVVDDWLLGNEPFLTGARPIDMLALGDVGQLLSALDAAGKGGYA